MSDQILPSLGLIITVFIFASVVQESYAQTQTIVIRGNVSEVASLFKKVGESPDDIGVILASIAAGIAGGGLFVAAIQMYFNRKVNNAQLWLSFRDFLSKYDEIHLKLREDREKHQWSPTDKEMAQVEGYMGLFEHANRMLDMNLIDKKTFKDIYRYRIENILLNPMIADDKFRGDKRQYWQNFIDLCRKVDLEIPH
jgi:hypothetical protein